MALVIALGVLAGCEEPPPAFPVPGGRAKTVALDAKFVVYTEGTWVLDEFDRELADQLVKYNLKVVGKTPAPDLVAEINLGIWGNRHAIDVYLARNGDESFAGRVGVPDLSWTTLDAAAEPVAQVIARKAWGIPEPPPPPEE